MRRSGSAWCWRGCKDALFFLLFYPIQIVKIFDNSYVLSNNEFYIESRNIARMPRQLTTSGIKVADEVWIVTALLQRENPEKMDFTVEEIVERAKRED